MLLITKNKHIPKRLKPAAILIFWRYDTSLEPPTISVEMLLYILAKYDTITRRNEIYLKHIENLRRYLKHGIICIFKLFHARDGITNRRKIYDACSMVELRRLLIIFDQSGCCEFTHTTKRSTDCNLTKVVLPELPNCWLNFIYFMIITSTQRHTTAIMIAPNKIYDLYLSYQFVILFQRINAKHILHMITPGTEPNLILVGMPFCWHLYHLIYSGWA